MTGRIDFYTKVHKALRASLFDLSQRAAIADYSDPQHVCALANRTQSTLARLSAHAAHESRFIHPLLARKVGHRGLDTEHEGLEADQAGLARLLEAVAGAPQAERRARGLVFYRALNVFVARYLEHLEREEATMPLLWAHCSDEELASVMACFGASRPVEEALADLGWMFPALNAAEQAELIGGMRDLAMR